VCVLPMEGDEAAGGEACVCGVWGNWWVCYDGGDVATDWCRLVLETAGALCQQAIGSV